MRTDQITVRASPELIDEFRKAARAEYGYVRERNGDASAPMVLRRMIIEYVDLFHRGAITRREPPPGLQGQRGGHRGGPKPPALAAKAGGRGG